MTVTASNPHYLVMPTRSSSLLTGLGFIMFSLFILSLSPDGPSLEGRLAMVLSSSCCLLSWLCVAWSEQYQTFQALTFCLHTVTLGLASWLAQTGILSLLQV